MLDFPSFQKVARAIAAAAYDDARTACLNEKIDAEATGAPDDEAYNRACDDCGDAIARLKQPAPSKDGP